MQTNQLSNVAIRREMFRLADLHHLRLTSPHHPLTYDNHSVLKSGAYWHWSVNRAVMTDGSWPVIHMGEFVEGVMALYPDRTVVMIPGGDFDNLLEVFIAARPSERSLADGKMTPAAHRALFGEWV